MLNESFPLRNTGFSNGQDSAHLARHRWYFVKESFSPRLVERAIEDSHCAKSALIVDPFSGSGTVPLHSSLHGFTSVGLEVNPFLAFVSKTKLLQVKPHTFQQHKAAVISGTEKGTISKLETFSSFSEDGGKAKWLFNTEVLRGFEGGWAATSNLYAPVRDLMRLSLIGAAMDTCNAFKDGKCLRYKKQWQKLNYGRTELVSALESRMKIIEDDLRACPNHGGSSTIFYGDSRKLIRDKVKKGFSLCVTSPPYLNSFDYSDVYRPELFLGKFVRSNEDLRLIRKKTVRSHIQASWEHPKQNAFGSTYTSVLNQVKERSSYLWDERIPLMIQAYFEDLEKILRELRELADPHASIWLVVSTSAYVGIEIPVDLILADIGTKVGWHLREVGVLRYLRSSGQHWKQWFSSDVVKPPLRESVIILDATPRICQI